MENLYAPWRSSYVSKKPKTKQCVFCQKIDETDDTKNYILKRFKKNTVFLNLYPYNAGHLLILTNNHTGDLEKLSEEERSELMEVANKSVKILKKILKPSGFNIGFNLGKDSGAGISSHLHMHIVPRWKGDTNFLPILSQTKQISFDLNKTYNILKKGFDKLKA